MQIHYGEDVKWVLQLLRCYDAKVFYSIHVIFGNERERIIFHRNVKLISIDQISTATIFLWHHTQGRKLRRHTAVF